MKGYSFPKTPNGKSSIVPSPPWHYVGTAMAISFEAQAEKIERFLPPILELDSNKCMAYFVEWQAVSGDNKEYLDPVRSQYKEAFILTSANYKGEKMSYCPFIWVDSDIALVRGHFQGWPKQLGAIWMTNAYDLPSKANPGISNGSKFGATLSTREHRIMDGKIKLEELTDSLPSPNFEKAVNIRIFPDLVRGNENNPLVHELVQLDSRDVKISPIWKGQGELKFYEHPYLEAQEFEPLSVGNGYRFTFAMTVDNLIPLQDLK